MTTRVGILRLWNATLPRVPVGELWRLGGVPLLAVLLFLFGWSRVSAGIETSLGQIPGPLAVWQQAGHLWA